MTTRGVRLLCCTAVLLALASFPALASTGPAATGPSSTSPAAPEPNVRIVRLSLAQGDVQIDRNFAGNQGQGWEQAINNMPLTSGTRLYAAEDSKAELEFEDGSTIRLAGPAQISLNQLSIAPDGSPVNQIEIDSGLVYINASNAHSGFHIQDSSGESFAVTQPSHLRFKVDDQVASLSVMDGEVELQNGGGNAKIRAGETYNYILGQPESAVRQSKLPPENEDTWDHQRDQYDDQYAAAGAQYSGSENPEAYGDADLGYYGAYQDIPGYGESWQPNDVGPDWDPFDEGAWSYYPDWGWTFVSAYPWGWCPFYFGNWNYINGRGWWWHPGPRHDHGGPHGPGHGGGGFHPQPMLASTPHGFSAPHPPTGSAHRTVALAGSNLRVGPIGLTHASMNSARATATQSTVIHMSGVSHSGDAASRAMDRPGANPSFAHGAPASNRAGSLIGGQRGAYYVTRPTPGRDAYDAHRPPVSYSGEAPRAYSYGDTSAPRTYAPRTYSPAPIERTPVAPPSSFATHVGGSGFSSGGGFHGGGGGFSGGGGFHGGGGGGGFRGGGGRR